MGTLGAVYRDWEITVSDIDVNRFVKLRFGIVLFTKGDTLAKMVMPFKMGVGGVVAIGNEYI